MPIYDAECPKCGLRENVWGKVDEVLVCDCGRKMKRLLSPTRINPDITPYLEENISQSPVFIKSRRHRAQVLKENGLAIRN
jgi:putative FmdB family regulatory protein